MKNFENSKNKKALGLKYNKNISIASIEGIAIRNFRTLRDQVVELGSHITILSGRNGTMKTSIMGLIAHPFNSSGKDVFGKALKTQLKEVFKFSPVFDNVDYAYDLLIRTAENAHLRETVSIYYVADNTERHRIVVSGAEKGDGNFSYNTSFLNLKRLYPLVHTEARPENTKALALSAAEGASLKDFYECVFPSSDYDSFTPIHEKNLKTTFAPTGTAATYDWHAISSGEDNLGSIFNRLLGFQRSFVKDQKFGNGILCIDEFESSLHPVAQLRLFDYLYQWSQKFKVQIVIATHSLHLISHIYLKHAANLDAGRVILNFISKSRASDNNYPILHNPDYNLAYKELTLTDPQQVAEARKVRVFCEDEFAVHFAKRLIKTQSILKAVEFHSTLNPAADVAGTSYSALRSLCVQFPLLLDRSLVIFDADVTSEVTSKIKNKALFLKLPDQQGLAIERRIIVFIIGLKNADPFFVRFKKERESFLDEFKASGLKSLTPSDVADATKTNISVCKNWAESRPADFRKYITYYCDAALNHSEFRDNFIDLINEINAKSGVPSINLIEAT